MNLFSVYDEPDVQSYCLTPAEVRVKMLQNLGLILTSDHEKRKEEQFSATPSIQTICSETLRAALWSASHQGTKPVYITRLLRTAYRLVEPAFVESTFPVAGSLGYLSSSSESASPLTDGNAQEDALSKLLRDTLNELEVLGDVAALPRGNWLPAPLHLVSLPFIHRWLLVGGRPSHHLPTLIRLAVEYSGPTRFLIQDPIEFGLQRVVQSEEEWCHIPHGNVDVWAHRITSETKLQPVEALDTSFEFYRPNIRRGFSTTQYFRWVDDIQALTDGRYLVRSKSRAHVSHYAIAEVWQGKIIATGVVELGVGDIRRLLYGIDALVGCPVKVQVTQSEGSWSFQLRSELPRAEHRLFTALGHLHLPSDGQYYPRTWEISAGYVIQAVRALQRLYIQLDGADELLSSSP